MSIHVNRERGREKEKEIVSNEQRLLALKAQIKTYNR
jgi:hypothetical protein